MTMLSTKDKIFQSALELFASQGIQATSTAQISKRAGVASGTLFVHFKSKLQRKIKFFRVPLSCLLVKVFKRLQLLKSVKEQGLLLEHYLFTSNQSKS